jgi:hypothetical protein
MRAVMAAVVLFSASVAGAGAPTSGLYLSAADFEQRQLTAQGECGSKGYKLDLRDVLRKPSVRVVSGSGTHEYKKSEVFGFRGCDGRDYRFVGNRGLQILEANELYIYASQIPISSGKGFRTVPAYHFSVGPAGTVQPLTIDNLKRAFPDNDKFHDTLDQMFGAGQNVAQYDEFRSTFKVNRLLLTSNDQ